MAWAKVILEVIAKVFGSIPYFNKWFSKSKSEKVGKKLDDSREKVDEFKKTNRPDW